MFSDPGTQHNPSKRHRETILNTLTLYTYFRSSAAFRVRIALRLKNLPAAHHAVSLIDNAHLQPEYGAIHPMKLVPALAVGGEVITQSLAILEYLDEAFPDTPPLVWGDALTRAKLQDEIERIRKEEKRTIILVTNDVDEALLLADRVAVLTPAPAARIGQIFDVSIPRPRDREAMNDDARFQALRRRSRALVRMMSSSFWTVAAWTGASTQTPFWETWRLAATRSASARRSWSRMVTVTFIRSPVLLGLAYQSVTITPPLLSVCSIGMKLSASRLARHR